MTNQQPDNFFREKLKNHQKPAPHAAWDKIAVRLQKKTQPKWIWLKFAASLLLLLGIGCMLWIINSNPSENALAQVKNKIQFRTTLKNTVPRDSAIDKASPTQENVPAKIHDDQQRKISTRKVIRPKRIDSTKFNVEHKQHHEILKEVVKEHSDNVSDIGQSHVIAEVASSNKSTMTLTFTAAETNKYLDKNALAEATQREKKSSTFKKLLKKANDLKSNQDPFGDLREKKNEILALNFKNEKRGQNK